MEGVTYYLEANSACRGPYRVGTPPPLSPLVPDNDRMLAIDGPVTGAGTGIALYIRLTPRQT